jgi:hypothetical protein
MVATITTDGMRRFMIFPPCDYFFRLDRAA